MVLSCVTQKITLVGLILADSYREEGHPIITAILWYYSRDSVEVRISVRCSVLRKIGIVTIPWDRKAPHENACFWHRPDLVLV